MAIRYEYNTISISVPSYTSGTAQVIGDAVELNRVGNLAPCLITVKAGDDFAVGGVVAPIAGDSITYGGHLEGISDDDPVGVTVLIEVASGKTKLTITDDV
ncbi:MAG: hypothetical protein J6S67_10425 [Methanobrevibacter sp.]|nr:hypothetical protein [Methanobrevibacter sp.]